MSFVVGAHEKHLLAWLASKGKAGRRSSRCSSGDPIRTPEQLHQSEYGVRSMETNNV